MFDTEETNTPNTYFTQTSPLSSFEDQLSQQIASPEPAAPQEIMNQKITDAELNYLMGEEEVAEQMVREALSIEMLTPLQKLTLLAQEVKELAESYQIEQANFLLKIPLSNKNLPLKAKNFLTIIQSMVHYKDADYEKSMECAIQVLHTTDLSPSALETTQKWIKRIVKTASATPDHHQNSLASRH